MSLYVSENSGSNFEPIEPGTYSAVCYGIVDIGDQYNETYAKYSPKIVILWELPEEKIIIDEKPVSRTISKVYTCSLNEKAALRRDLAAWRGRDFTPEELKRFYLGNILGAPCMLNIIQRESNGKQYTAIGAIMKLPKGMQTPEGTLEHITFDLETGPLESLDELPKWITERAKQSRTYKERIEGQGDKPGDDNVNHTVSAGDFAELGEDNGELPF